MKKIQMISNLMQHIKDDGIGVRPAMSKTAMADVAKGYPASGAGKIKSKVMASHPNSHVVIPLRRDPRFMDRYAELKRLATDKTSYKVTYPILSDIHS